MAEALGGIAGVPYHREGFVFELPGVAIRVAEECSGIRSTLALLITTVLASYIFLKSSWKRLVLCLAVVPIAIFKNSLRIATLSTLSVYVNPSFLQGNLHHRRRNRILHHCAGLDGAASEATPEWRKSELGRATAAGTRITTISALPEENKTEP